MSIVNLEQSHIFIHVPKTGGTSMEQMPFVGGTTHDTASDLFRQCRDQDHDPKDFFKWAFVRHPVDRLQSAYYSYQQHFQPKGITPPYLVTFNLFVREFDRNRDWKRKYFMLRDQSFFLDEELDFIGRFERINEDWKFVCKRITGEVSPLPRKNPTKRNPVFISSPIRGLIEDIYQEDFDRFYWLDHS